MTDGFPTFDEPRAVDDRRSWSAAVESFDQYRDILYYALRLLEVGRATHTFIAAVTPGDDVTIERELQDIATKGQTNTAYAGYQLQHAPTCHGGGWLVGMDEPLPTDAATYASEGGAICGCNQLRCRSCGAYVRHFDNMRCRDLPLAANEAANLYKAADPHAYTLAYDAHDTRAYACRCNYAQENGSRSVASLDDATWYCGGHPQL